MVPPATEAKDLAGFRDTLAEDLYRALDGWGNKESWLCKEGNQVATRLWEAPRV
jgi:hypothetical protein